MVTLGLSAFFFICLLFIPICRGKSGFILTSPKVIDAGSTEYFALTLFDVANDGNVTLSLRRMKTDDIIAQNVLSTTEKFSARIEMFIPPMSDTEAILEMKGEFSSGYQIDERKLVKIRGQSIITFVQTDKPVYKPGQTVKFRVLPMDSLLKPLKENAFGDIWIEDPGAVRIAQWKNVNFIPGIVQLELPLSEEPVLGVYSIKSTIRGISHTQKFSVEEYVLPKFEVIITPPSYIMIDAEVVITQICAQYTYGERVDGFLKATMTYTKRRWERTVQSFSYEGMISGCHQFVVKSTDISLDKVNYINRDIIISAEVTENGTEITQNASTVVKLSKTPLEMTFLDVQEGNRYFKPGLPYYGKLRVTKPDKRPVAFEEVEVFICATSKGKESASEILMCRFFTTDREGEINFSIPAQSSEYHTINLKAIAKGYWEQPDHHDHRIRKVWKPRAEATLKSWFSPTESHLQIGPVTEKLQCGQQTSVKIRYTTRNGSALTFYYQVIARGRIVHQGLHHLTFHSTKYNEGNPDDPLTLHLVGKNNDTSGSTVPQQFGEFELTFDVRATMSPIVRLLVFYVHADGEVVADSRKFDITHCLQNEARLNFRHDRQYPSTEASIDLSASPSSLCGIGLVDKSVHLMQPDKQINKEKVFRLLRDYDLNAGTQPTQTSRGHCGYGSMPHFDFDHSLLLPDLHHRHHLGHWGYHYYTEHVDTITAFEDAGTVVMSDFVLETRPCNRRPFFTHRRHPPGNYHAHLFAGPMMAKELIPEVAVFERNDVFDLDLEEPKEAAESVAEIRAYFPETWLWELHTVGETGIMTLNRTLPDTVTEWVGSAICVSPETGLGISNTARITAFQPFFISFTLPYSVIRNEVIPVVITVFNYLSECIPIKLSLEPSEAFEIVRESRIHKLCVCGGKSKTHRFYIRPVALGQVNVTVYGFSLKEDTVCGNETTITLIARDAVTRPLLVEAEGFPKEEVYNRFFCLNGSDEIFSTEVDLFLPENVVKGSARAFLSLAGDLMGPALDKLDDLVRLPMGCGEQNMIRFVPNIVVLDYLTATGRITEDIKSKTISHMKTGYQRELRYRHSDGSYSAFGSSDSEGSMWLTAFVIRSFSQAKRFIPIDENDLVLSANWIARHQLPDGCFLQVGRLFNNAMKGGLHRSGQSLAPLTAYVLMALIEAGLTDSNAKIRSATNCLRADANPSTYSLSLYAYAMAMSKDSDAERYLDLLESRAIIEGNTMYWKYENERSKSIDVEISAYAILAMLEFGGSSSVPKVLPIVRWIAEQRNSNGGFVSTQDTVVALQALARYASYTSATPVNIAAAIVSDELIHSFRIDDSNKLVMQSLKLPVFPTVVDFQASGEGCAIAQFNLRYNVESVQRSQAFDLGVTTSRNESQDCDEASITICMRYRYLQQKSNMAVATAKMVSGYVPDKRSLQKLQNDETLTLKRLDVNRNEINFYFDELTNEETCFLFLVKNVLGVDNAKPATVKLYDYYQLESEVTESYEILSTCISSMEIP